ncbi:DNA-binding domain-containing protein [Lysobacter panacisoli]|uniref:DUF2063 domain-containing protein n=1 Tax=Lysobacter panacisoli TaxID=1255263 RepID=A0ABP9LCC3_9GAMM|nr:putative DNA-binding domain-containing protein [Lysobacter panacisoli]
MLETLRQQQFALARHLRDPSVNAPPPGIEERRLRVYRELFFNAIESLLSTGFPVARETLGDAAWKALVRRFYAQHRSRTPLFPQIAGEFVAWLDTQPDDGGIPAWLPDLAHYEWIEQALFVSDEQPLEFDPHGDLLDGVPLLSPLAMPLAYRWPVTDIGPGHAPATLPESATTLLVHRDAAHQVRFARIAPLAYELLVSLRTHARTGREHLTALAADIGADATELQAYGIELLEQLRAQRIVLGAAIVPPA